MFDFSKINDEEQFYKHFKNGSFLSKGAFGAVYQVWDKKNSTIAALKRIAKKDHNENEVRFYFS